MERYDYKIIVTGSRGYIGSELSSKIRNNGINYISIDKLNDQSPNSLCFDLCDYKKTIEAIKNFKPDILVHCGTNSAIAYRDNFFESFVEDFQSLVNILKSINPNCRLIYFSSSYVYSGLAIDKKFDEDALLLPKHNFGVAKLFFEQFILRNHKNSVIFRLSSVFGEGKGRCPNTILNFVNDCLEKGKIEVWGKGNRKIQYVFINDVIDCILKSFHFEPGIYNLGGDDYLSVSDVAHRISNFFGSKVLFLEGKPEGETLPFIVNNKIKDISNKISFTPFSSSLDSYLNSFK